MTDGEFPAISDWPKNVTYMGAFTSFSQLPRDYAVFLYTSLWDGLPNILLEVAKSGLPIVAPRVGGIGVDLPEELIYLYSLESTVDEVATIIETAISQVQVSMEKASKLREFVVKNYSETSSTKSVFDLAIAAGTV